MSQDPRLTFLQACAKRGWLVHGVDEQHCMVELPKRLWMPGMTAGGMLFIAGAANPLFMFPAILLWVGMLWEYADRKKRLYCLTWAQVEKREFPDGLFVE